MAKKPKAPSGLGISRSGNYYIFSWSRGAKYTSQQLGTSVGGVSVSGGASSASIYSTANSIQFWVRGKKKKWSSWSYSGVYSCAVPNNPTVTKESIADDKTVFKWECPVSDSDNRPFTRIEWESVLIQDSNTADGSTVNWEGAEKGTSSIASGDNAKWQKDELGFSIDEYSFTRWFRARAVGRVGATGWFYVRRVFALPEPAKNVKAKRTQLTSGGFSISTTWTSPATEAKPIDKVTVQYRKSAPDVEVTYPSESDGTVKMRVLCPDNSSDWQSRNDVGGIAGERALSFTDAYDLETDRCLFLRINNTFDNNTREGVPILVENGVGKLTNPSTPTVTSDGSVDNLYNVSVTRNTTIDEAAIAVYFRCSSEQDKPVLIGIIPGAHGSTPASTSTSCIIPEFPDGDDISFGVKAFIGNYAPKLPQSDSEPTYYDVGPTDDGIFMESEVVWGEGVPLPPRNVALVKINDSTVQVGWTWSWRDANQAELSWADHDDAWESTDEPQVYNVGSNNIGRWNIAGLGIGTWYIRVRLFKVSGDSVMYGAYSPTQVIKLSASPDTPSLVLSSGVIPKDGQVTCYWAFVSNDGTAQQQGEVCEAFPEYEAIENPTGSPIEQVWYELVDEKYVRSYDTSIDPNKTYYRTTGNITYGDPIASTVSAQHITLNAEDYGWEPGETHHLAVRVMSVSGEASEGWSAPVPVSIAEELECEITNTSFVTESVTKGGITSEVISLKALPMTATAVGAGTGGSTTFIIERASDYDLDRPDGSTHQGFEGETIYMSTPDQVTIDQNGGASVTINQSDLIGALDDGAPYRLIAIVKDSYGQIAESSVIGFVYEEVQNPTGDPSANGWYVIVEDAYILTTDTEVESGTTYYMKRESDTFEVHWTHQAVDPEAIVEVETEHHVTFITPIMPESGYVLGDVCDIYRLSTDKPELIVEGAAFGTKYVDPYPAFGDFGGHRVVYRTLNGDYITDEDEIAWADYTADEDPAYKHDLFGIVIDFDDEQLILPYNVSINNTWSKDFTQTKYLGGSIQGDWNPAVEKSVSANTVIPVEVEPDNVELLRRLAVYPGICHVRMPDSSSFTANVDVRDNREEKWVTRVSKVSLEIKACDSDGFDGMTYAEWLEEISEDE